jgi:hypothetical protein
MFLTFSVTEKGKPTKNRRVSSKTVRASLQRKTHKEENFLQEYEIYVKSGKEDRKGE